MTPNPQANPTNETRARERRVRRPWRLAFIGFALAMTVGTHWPRLQLAPEIPATDKSIHLMAFATLTVLIWRTGWIGSRWLLLLLGLAWAAADELSQGIPVLNRHVSWHDVMANALGVLVAAAWLWALRPAGVDGGANRLRLRLNEYTLDEVFARSSAWLALLISAAIVAAPLILIWRFLDVRGARLAIGAAAGAIMILTWLQWRRLWYRQQQRIAAEQPCLRCGTASASGASSAACARCGSAIDEFAYEQPRFTPLRTALGLSMRPALMALLIISGAFALILVTPHLYAWILNTGPRAASSTAQRIVRFFAALPQEFSATVDLALLLLLLAGTARIYRTAVARFHDRGIACRRCGHDLRGTPVDHKGRGRCGECGVRFLRSA